MATPNANRPLNTSRINQAAAAALSKLGPTPFPNGSEILDYTFYDRKSWVTVTAAQNTYFATPGTSDLVSNFIGSGSMPANQAFLVSAIRMIPLPGSPIADVISMMRYLSLVFTLENAKKYFQGPAFLLPGGVGAQLEGTTTAFANTGNNGVPALGNTYRLSQPILLRPQQPFAVNVTADVAFTAGTSPMQVYVALDGLLVRGIL